MAIKRGSKKGIKNGIRKNNANSGKSWDMEHLRMVWQARLASDRKSEQTSYKPLEDSLQRSNLAIRLKACHMRRMLREAVKQGAPDEWATLEACLKGNGNSGAGNAAAPVAAESVGSQGSQFTAIQAAGVPHITRAARMSTEYDDDDDATIVDELMGPEGSQTPTRNGDEHDAAAALVSLRSAPTAVAAPATEAQSCADPTIAPAAEVLLANIRTPAASPAAVPAAAPAPAANRQPAYGSSQPRLRRPRGLDINDIVE